MSKKTYSFHHGSPGLPSDFLQISIENSENKYNFKNRSEQLHTSSDIVVGYSFGCVRALKEAVLTPNTKKLYLIAPYLLQTKPVGALKSFLLNLPVIGDGILRKAGAKAIEEMIISSCAPATPTEFYQSQARSYTEPRVLKLAMFEKDFDLSDTINDLKQLREKNIEVIMISGDQDSTLNQEDLYHKLKVYLPELKRITIKNGGHALIFTHADEVKAHIHQEGSTKSNSERLGYFEGTHEKNNVASFLSKHVNEIPTKPILSWVPYETIAKWNGDLNTPLEHQSITVAELDALVARLAHSFQKMGIEKGDRAIIFVPMSLYLYASMFALQKLGAMAVFLDSWARRDQMGAAAKVVDAKVMVSVDKAFQYLGEIPEIAQIPLKICVGPSEAKYTANLEELMHTTEMAPITPVEKEHTALITFTTGSSGTPKGADRTHRFLAAQHYALNKHIPYAPTDADLPVFPIFSLNNLAAGVNTIIPAIDVGQPNEKDPLILIAQMKSTNTTCTTLSPSLLRAVYQFCLAQNITLDFLKRIVTGGAPVSKDDMEATKKIAPNAEILVLYGSTEVEPMAHIEATEMLGQKESDDPEWVEDGVNVGLFDNGLDVRFLKITKETIMIKKKEDWNEHLLPKGQVGEIIVAGEHVCEGYYNNEEAFFRAKIRDEEGRVWHRTGDLGRLDDQNNLWLVGRVHNAINRGGEYLFPVRAEIVLKKLDFVQKAAFLGMPDSELGERTFAVFTLKEGIGADIEKQRAEVQRIMDKNKITVDQILCVDDIPMDPRHHSKVEYEKLREIINGQS
ncbi:MAG: AMP-binding protein [Oligoflexia bacterium]|nr:AMP-binding protein [Oligoflexia bacterium]